VSLLPGAEPKLAHADGEAAADRKWSLYSVEPADGYVGALAVPDPGRRVDALHRMTVAAVLDSMV